MADVLMVDCIGSNVDQAPTDVEGQAVAGYAGYLDCAPGYEYIPSYEALKAKFPGVPVKSITTQPSSSPTAADVCDVEAGDYSPAQGASWASSKIQANAGRPTVYCSESDLPTCQAEFTKLGHAVTDCDWWVAGFATPPDPSVPAGCIGHQYADMGTYDVSMVDEAWLTGTAPVPAPAPESAPAPSPAPQPRGVPTVSVNLPELRQGMVDGQNGVSGVKALQALCNLANQGLTVDGNFGPLTNEAVMAVQRWFQISVDGIVGPQTWTVLHAS